MEDGCLPLIFAFLIAMWATLLIGIQMDYGHKQKALEERVTHIEQMMEAKP